MPKVRRPRLWQIALGVVVALALAIVFTARHGDSRLYPAHGNTVTVHVLNYGFHTDIAIPAELILPRGGRLAEAARAAGNWKWFVIGWGDESFYTGAGASMDRAIDGLRSLFWPGNPSVIRITGLNTPPDKTYLSTDTASLALSLEGFEAMAQSIEGSFRAGPGQPLVSSGLRDMPGVFFPARGDFSVLRTCNNWTSDQLNAAGLPTTPMIDGLAPLLAWDTGLRAGLQWQR
jgi:uncharacterized protein (TIGR02117 family)